MALLGQRKMTKEEILLRLNPILRSFLADGFVTFKRLSEKFKRNNGISLEDLISSPILEFFENIKVEEHEIRVENDENGEIIIVFGVDNELGVYIIPSEPEEAEEEDEEEEETILAGNFGNFIISVENIEAKKFWPDVIRMFSPPSFPRKSPEYRDRNFKCYETFLKLAKEKWLENDKRKLNTRAKELAGAWWGPVFPYYPQIMYIVKKVGELNPNGFDLMTMEEKVEEAFLDCFEKDHPDRRFWDLRIPCSDFILYNLFVPCDKRNRTKLKVNKIIDFIEFHQILHPPNSIIYQFVSSTPSAKKVEDIREILVANLPAVAATYSESQITDFIENLSTNSPRMFRIGDPGIYAKGHAHKIPLPRMFSLKINAKSCGIKF